MSAPAAVPRTVEPVSTAELAALVRDATTEAPLRIAGAGTWLDAGHPVRAAHRVSLRRMTGIVAYRPDDLTLSCRAGTTLAELDDATRAHGQWCPLLPWGDDAGTVGATVATATAGPFAERLGRPRNLVLGLEAVDGRARVIRAGARVVKNVAGFDLTRAITGSWGTLAVITEVHLRLRARPAVDETWEVRLVAPPAACDAWRRGPLAPMAWVDLPADGATRRALVRIGGNHTFVDAARAALHALGAPLARDAAAWTGIRRSHAPPDPAVRWTWSPLAARLRAAFDPAHLLNPGLLGAPDATSAREPAREPVHA